jgi:CheY-like chemotaxis protein
LARRLAERHGGSLVASSSGEGRGTTFTLRLPAEPEVTDANSRPDDGSAARTAEPSGHRVLVIEDNPDVADTLVVWLEDLGHRVWVARTGRAGVDLVTEARPDLVLCDLGLPDIDGLEVCRRIRSLGLAPRPRMVALTGWGRGDDRRRTKDAGFDTHIVKPVAEEKLLEVLRSVASTPDSLTAE